MNDEVQVAPEEFREPAFRRASTAVAAAAVLLALLFACPCAIGAIFVARSFVSESKVEYRVWVDASGRVAWCGQGRFGVVQTSDPEGEPVVLAWDSATGETHSLTGCRLATVERHGAVVWLVPMDRGQLSEHPDGEWDSVLVPAEGPFDAVPESLLAWDLTVARREPVASRDLTWMRWPGPGPWSATAVIDPERGAYPSDLLLGESAVEADDRRASLPGNFGTFDVVGWSPSGRYLALAELLDVGAVPQEAFRRIIIVDAQSGETISEARQNASQGQGSTPVWYPDGDVLVWTEHTLVGEAQDASGDGVALRAMEPGGVEVAAFDALGESVSRDWIEAERVSVYGSGPKGILIGLQHGGDNTLWWFGRAAAEPVASLPGVTLATVYHSGSGLLVLVQEHDEESKSRRDSLLHVPFLGDEGRVVWEGEWRAEER